MGLSRTVDQVANLVVGKIGLSGSAAVETSRPLLLDGQADEATSSGGDEGRGYGHEPKPSNNLGGNHYGINSNE